MVIQLRGVESLLFYYCFRVEAKQRLTQIDPQEITSHNWNNWNRRPIAFDLYFLLKIKSALLVQFLA